ncbi:MAG: hypothetical protein NTV36_01995 [Candidatus Staskawiczbacteria bacterium]|nr:hypothetical protein [Candidatus Staskawiczbacteria bacterium]
MAETKIEDFYQKYFNSKDQIAKITLGDLKEFKKESITTEQFLDYLCQKKGLLLHGSIHQIDIGKLTAKKGKIFAANKAVIAIMRSLHSNSDINLQYPYFISGKNPFWFEIHTKGDGKLTNKDKGFVYILNNDGFKNEPKGSWQFVKETEKIDIVAVIETENNDFTYSIKILNDYKPEI